MKIDMTINYELWKLLRELPMKPSWEVDVQGPMPNGDYRFLVYEVNGEKRELKLLRLLDKEVESLENAEPVYKTLTPITF